MSAVSFDFFVSYFPDPNVPNRDPKAVYLNSTFAFDWPIINSNAFTTIFSSDARGNDQIQGVLFVPDLPPDNPCNDTSIIPDSVTRLSNIPPGDIPITAYAPWISKECSLAYIQSVNNLDPLISIIFYNIIPAGVANYTFPGNTSFALDGGYDWVNVPVFAIDGKWGQPLMQMLGSFSGNLTQILSPQNFTDYPNFDPGDIPRVIAAVQIGGNNPMPGLWLFLLIVVAILFCVVGVTSMLMHVLQFRYRRNLRRRIATGEVDLEALGIKRLTVPKDVLNKFPTHVYKSPAPDQASNTPPSTSETATPNVEQAGNTSTGNAPEAAGFHQPSCPICLEDFVDQETTVRQLPCRHIYHPECIDPFLETRSSLCPLCKASVLPKGYIPVKLTNATVRRERFMRRHRSRHGRNAEEDQGNGIPLRPVSEPLPVAGMSRRERIEQFYRRFTIHGPPISSTEEEPVRQSNFRRLIRKVFPGFT